MKKLLALVLALVLCLSVVACTKSNETKSDDTNKESTDVTENNTEDDSSDGSLVVETTPPALDDEDESENSTLNNDNSLLLESYLKINKAQIIESMESGFTKSGLTCTSDIEVIGNGFVITIKINEIDNADEMLKASMQAAYDQVDAQFEQYLTSMQLALPVVEYIKIIICDKSGTELAVINADGNVIDGSTLMPSTEITSVQDFVDKYGDIMSKGFERIFQESTLDLTFHSDIKAEGNNVVITIKVDELENVDDATKAQMQETLDNQSMAEVEPMLDALKAAVPNFESIKYVLVDKNGDVLATFALGGDNDISAAAPATGFKRHEINGVTIDIPEKYTSSEVQGITLFYTDKYPTLTDNISIQFSSQRLTLANFSEEALKKDLDTSYGAIGATYEITGYEVYKTDGNDSVKCTLKTNLSGVEMIQTQYFIILDNGFFSSTFTDVSGEYTEEFKTIAESIKVK